MSRLDAELELKVASARRVEVITGGGRRRWSDDEKARAIEASLAPGAVVSAVARGHGVTPQQLFTWRRNARRKAMESASAAPFVPAVVALPETFASSSAEATAELSVARLHTIELDIDGTSVWVWPGAEAAMVTAIIGALKGGP